MINKMLKKLGLEIHKIKEDHHYVNKIYGRAHKKLIDCRADLLFNELALPVVEAKTTMLYYDRLYNLYQTLTQVIELRKLHGDRCLNLLEAGVYKGGSSYFTASIMEKKWDFDYKLFAVDTFQGHSTEDIPQGKDGDHGTGTFTDTSFEGVKNYLGKFKSVQVVQSRVQEFAITLDETEFDYIYLDMDIYEPTKFCLEYFVNKLKIGGVFLLDDYKFRSCPSIEKVANEFMANKKNLFGIDLRVGQFVIIKIDE